MNGVVFTENNDSLVTLFAHDGRVVVIPSGGTTYRFTVYGALRLQAALEQAIRDATGHVIKSVDRRS